MTMSPSLPKLVEITYLPTPQHLLRGWLGWNHRPSPPKYQPLSAFFSHGNGRLTPRTFHPRRGPSFFPGSLVPRTVLPHPQTEKTGLNRLPLSYIVLESHFFLVPKIIKSTEAKSWNHRSFSGPFFCVFFWSCSEHFGQGPRTSDFGAQFSGVIKCITNSTPPKKTNGGLKFQVSREKMQGTKLAKIAISWRFIPGRVFFNHPSVSFFRCSVVFWRSSVPSRCFFNIGVAGAWDRWMFPVHKKKPVVKLEI